MFTCLYSLNINLSLFKKDMIHFVLFLLTYFVVISSLLLSTIHVVFLFMLVLIVFDQNYSVSGVS